MVCPAAKPSMEGFVLFSMLFLAGLLTNASGKQARPWQPETEVTVFVRTTDIGAVLPSQQFGEDPEGISYNSTFGCIQEALAGAVGSRSSSDEMINIVLLPQSMTDCHILLSRRPAAVQFSPPMGHVRIVSSPSPGCNHSMIIYPHEDLNSQANTEKKITYFELSQTSHVVFRGLRFSVQPQSTIFNISASRLIKIDDCCLTLSGGWRQEHSILVSSSHYVFMTNCQVIGNLSEEKEYLIMPGRLKDFRTVLEVSNREDCYQVVDVSEADREWLVSDAADGWIRLSLKEAGAFENASLSQSPVGSTVNIVMGILNCSFHHAGVDTPQYSQLEYSSHYIRGSAIQIHLYPSTQPTFVHIENTSFSDLSGPESSALSIRVHNESTLNFSICDSSSARAFDHIGHRHVRINNCQFLDNIGLLGAAIYARFEDSVEAASVAIGHSYFEGNCGRNAGGAVFIRFAGRTLPHVCVTIYNCTFKRNYVFRKWGYRHSPGAAIMSMSNFPADSIDDPTFRCYPLEGQYPVNIFSSTFSNNSGFGAYFSRSVSTAFYDNT